MEVEGTDVAKQTRLVDSAINLDRRRHPVWRRCRPQTEEIIDGYAEPGQQCACEAAKTLPRRNALVAMVKIFDELALCPVLST